MTLDANLHCTKSNNPLGFPYFNTITSLYRGHILSACVSPAELYILKTCAENETLNGYEELNPDIQNAIMENFQTEPLPSWPLLKLNHLKLPIKLGHGRNGAGKRSLLTRKKKIGVPRRKSLGLRIKERTSARKLGESRI